jgi:hypothetical protein
MTLFQLAPALEAVETALTWGAKAYALGSEIFTISAILWCINFLANAIQKVYAAGYHFGRFYRAYLHQHLVKLSALIILLCILAFEGAVIAYKNRHKLTPAVDTFRNWLGSQFAAAYSHYEQLCQQADATLFSLCWAGLPIGPSNQCKPQPRCQDTVQRTSIANRRDPNRGRGFL